MAHIVPFRVAAAREAEEAEAGSAGGAQIIIFPGVRRERHIDPPSEPSWPGETRPERDVLELPD